MVLVDFVMFLFSGDISSGSRRKGDEQMSDGGWEGEVG
jgi:hypothetical protein